MKRKMSLPGHNSARTGGGIQGANCPKISQLIKKVVRNFAGRIQSIFEGIQEPRWPRASNSLCTPLRPPPLHHFSRTITKSWHHASDNSSDFSSCSALVCLILTSFLLTCLVLVLTFLQRLPSIPYYFKIYSAVNRSELTPLALYGVSSAFYIVNHDILLEHLKISYV